MGFGCTQCGKQILVLSAPAHIDTRARVICVDKMLCVWERSPRSRINKQTWTIGRQVLNRASHLWHLCRSLIYACLRSHSTGHRPRPFSARQMTERAREKRTNGPQGAFAADTNCAARCISNGRFVLLSPHHRATTILINCELIWLIIELILLLQCFLWTLELVWPKISHYLAFNCVIFVFPNGIIYSQS